MKNRVNLGFNLIELLVVIAIVGVLAAIAVPSYTSYKNETKLVEAVNFGASLKAEVEEQFAMSGKFPHAGRVNVGGDVVSSYEYYAPREWQTGTKKAIWIHVYLQNGAYPGATTNQGVMLQGRGESGSVQWTCGTHPGFRKIPEKYLPSSCNKALAYP